MSEITIKNLYRRCSKLKAERNAALAEVERLEEALANNL